MGKMLNNALLNDKAYWEGKNACLPKYSRTETPINAICFSMGRMGFGHFADIIQDILNKGGKAGTITGVETFSKQYYEGLVSADTLVTQIIYGNEKGQATPKIQGAITKALFLGGDDTTEDWQFMLKLAKDPNVQYATINAPEIVYGMKYDGGEFATPSAPKVIADMENGTYTSDPGKWTRFALERFNAGLNFAFVSCTNFSKNGFFTGAVIRTMGHAWEEKGFAPKGFTEYLSDKTRMGFPNTMVDRIAVSPDAAVSALMEKLDLSSSVIVTEENRYWAIEDVFPGGRPEFEKADGVFMCESFEELKKYEDMKLRILNMSHTVIASLGVLLGYRGAYGIYKAMQDERITNIISDIIKIVESVIAKPSGIKVETFVSDTFKRLNNPNIPDDPMRIALNASTKIMPRLMDTYWDAYEDGRSEDELAVILKPVAGILRYTFAIDDNGEEYKLEDDPALELMKTCAEKAKAGACAKDAFKEMLEDAHIFGKNMFDYPSVLDTLCKYTDAMMPKGGVAAIL